MGKSSFMHRQIRIQQHLKPLYKQFRPFGKWYLSIRNRDPRKMHMIDGYDNKIKAVIMGWVKSDGKILIHLRLAPKQEPDILCLRQGFGLAEMFKV